MKFGRMLKYDLRYGTVKNVLDITCFRSLFLEWQMP